MSAQHTPGPWVVENGQLRGPREEFGGAPVIADLHTWDNDAADEARANAALLKAAPDLLALAEQLLERGIADTPTMIKAQAAVDRAKGLTP